MEGREGEGGSKHRQPTRGRTGERKVIVRRKTERKVVEGERG